MMIDVNKIKEAIFSGTSKEASEITGIPKRTIDNYRASETAVNHRKWQGISLDKAMEIMNRLTENESSKKQRRYDLRTKEYLDGIKANHGLTGIVTDHKDVDFVSFKEEISNGDIVKIGQITDGRWCAAIAVEASEDTYTAKYYFDRMPTLFSFETMQKINKLEFDFVTRKLYEEYTCNYCYNHVDHWLNYDGSLDARIDALRNQRCGACQTKLS